MQRYRGAYVALDLNDDAILLAEEQLDPPIDIDDADADIGRRQLRGGRRAGQRGLKLRQGSNT